MYVGGTLYPEKKSFAQHQCDECCKRDVCSIRNETIIAMNDINEIASRKHIYISTITRCEKFSPEAKTMRSGF